ncbi:MAG: class I SAM-dependent RNA methyltransferase [Candidatus Sericytochromatia bacterium]
MQKYNISIACAFGIESLVADELKALGYENLKLENGKVHLEGTLKDIATFNIRLRTADRVLIKIVEFEATSFDDLFDGVFSFEWYELLPENANIHVTGKSVKSKLFSVPDCQGIVKKAIIEKMKTKYKKSWFSEVGETFKIEVSLLKDVATITLDTTGSSLHKRGYRKDAGDAPLKETLAASLIILSKWEPSRLLADPFCGSGTIAIEAAMIGKNIAPGICRNFSAEAWSWFPQNIWEEVREKAISEINDNEFRILASDINGKVLQKARENAQNANVEELIAFQKLDISEFSSKKRYGCIISNPPYGERIGSKEKVDFLYEELGRLYRDLDTWSIFTLTSNLEFEKLFGKKAHKNRKLYNGNLLCYFYSHYGPLPDKLKYQIND